MTPPKLQIDENGWIKGITHHRSPFYTPGGMSVPRGVQGLVVHTMVGNLAGTDNEFLHTHYSSHFGTGQDGTLIQWVDIKGGAAEAQAGGNGNWYSIEDADNLNPSNPFTQPQINRIAQVLELTSRVGNFPLQLTSSPSGEGLGWHGMGGVAWGNHPDCPGRVRRAQLPGIVALAKQIRSGTPTPPAFKTWTTKGMLTLAALADQLHYVTHNLLKATLLNSGQQEFGPLLAEHINTVFAGDAGLIPAGCWFYVPGYGAWITKGMASLNDLASVLQTTPAAILAVVVEHAPGHNLPDHTAKYVNDVFGRTTVKCPAGVVLHY
jgi:N-acetylmuramoyl-L-alanine amidase-like protein